MHEQRAGRRLPSRRAVHVELPGASTGGGPHRVLRTTPDPRHESGPASAPELTSRRLSRCADARETSCTKVSRTMALLPPAKSSRAWFRRTPAPGVRAGGACAPGRLEVPALAERRPWRRHPSARRSAPARDRCCCRQTTWLSCTCPSRRRSTRRRAGPSPKVHLNQGGYF
jgi:hypothetical protein